MRGGNLSVITRCYTIPIPGLLLQETFDLALGVRYQNSPMILNGTFNLTSSG